MEKQPGQRPQSLGTVKTGPQDPSNMIPLAQHGTYPIEILGPAVLLVSIAITAAWVIYFYR